MNRNKIEHILGYTLQRGDDCLADAGENLLVFGPTKIFRMRQQNPTMRPMTVYFWDVVMALPAGAGYFFDKYAVLAWNRAMERYKTQLQGLMWPTLPWPEGIEDKPDGGGGVILRRQLPDKLRERLKAETREMIRSGAKRAEVFARVAQIYREHQPGFVPHEDVPV